RKLMRDKASDVRLLRRLIHDARPFWPHLATIVLLSASAVPIALLLPLPLKLVVDSILGKQPLPHLLSRFISSETAASPRAMLVVAAGLLVTVSLLQHLEG